MSAGILSKLFNDSVLKSYVFKRREKNQAEKKSADLVIGDFQSLGKTKLPRGPRSKDQGGNRTQVKKTCETGARVF